MAIEGTHQLGFGGPMARRPEFQPKIAPATAARLCYSAVMSGIARSTAALADVERSTAQIEGC